ncbi:YjgN family protein [Desulfobotulus alkaliphilus]|nr:YjgN family protein [Desulfobotulus alkaliphilus]
MNQIRFDVVFQGRLMDGHKPEEVADSLSRMFGLPLRTAENLIQSPRAVLKRGLSEEAAAEYVNALRKAGLEVLLEPVMESQKEVLQPDAGSGGGGGAEEAAEPDGKSGSLKRLPFSFHGSGSEYFRIWIVNLLLTIVTLGIYSAWAKVRRKRYFYMNTRLDGRGFAYLADPVKILIGRIVVVAIFAVYSVTSSLNPLVSLGFAVVFLIVFPWIVVRSITFNARNSSFRNIRFAFHGKVWGAAQAYVLWPLAGILTLGLLWPCAVFQQHRFFISGSAYGKTRFSFHARIRDYYRMFFSLSLPLFITLGVFAFIFYYLMRIIFVTGGTFFFSTLFIFLFMAFLYLYFMAWYAVKTTNIFYCAALLSDHGFEADLKVFQYMLILGLNTLLTVLTLGFFHPWAKVRVARYKADHMAFLAAGSLEHFLANEEKRVASLGEEAADFMGFDFGV